VCVCVCDLIESRHNAVATDPMRTCELVTRQCGQGTAAGRGTCLFVALS
jgi:hypothetical protein